MKKDYLGTLFGPDPEPLHPSDKGYKEMRLKNKKAKVAKKMKYYVGHSNEPHKREVFGSREVPTKESHPQYGHVRSGFKSKKEANESKNYY